MPYPTPKEIFKKEIKFDKNIIKIILSWKKEFIKNWKNISKKEKIINLSILIWALNLEICFQEKNKKKALLFIKKGTEYCYIQSIQTICQDILNPSIISALHELAHHLYGPSELKACQWSVQLFKKCFPRLFKKLKFKNHTLIKK